MHSEREKWREQRRQQQLQRIKQETSSVNSQQSQPHLNASGSGFSNADVKRWTLLYRERERQRDDSYRIRHTRTRTRTDKWNKLQYYFIYSNVFISFSVYTFPNDYINMCANICRRASDCTCVHDESFSCILKKKLIYSSDVVWLTRTDVSARHDLYKGYAVHAVPATADTSIDRLKSVRFNEFNSRLIRFIRAFGLDLEINFYSRNFILIPQSPVELFNSKSDHHYYHYWLEILAINFCNVYAIYLFPWKALVISNSIPCSIVRHWTF